MKLIIQNNRIAAIATDDYTGPMDFIQAPDEFDVSTVGSLRVVDGALVEAVPQAVSRFQARMALRAAGMFDAVEAMMADPEAPIAAVEAWQTAQEFRRLSPTISAMAQALGLTDEQLDDLFRAAGKIEA